MVLNLIVFEDCMGFTTFIIIVTIKIKRCIGDISQLIRQ